MAKIRDRINKSLELESEAFQRAYRERPIAFLEEKCGRKYPPKLRECFEDIYFLRVTRPAVVANRGGGKSTLFADLAACLYLFRHFDGFIVGGSEAQAKNCYNYAAQDLQIDERLEDFNAEITKTLATSSVGNWLKFAAASTKRVRGPHCGDPHKEMGMIEHGGITIIDEECETDEEIVTGAKYTINTATPAILVRGSTWHKLEGSFARLVEDPGAQKATLYKWDCFDTAEKCTRSCKKCRYEFAGRKRPGFDKWRKKHPEWKHERGYCEGKAKRGSGWRRIWGDDPGTIESSFEGAENLGEFEVEEMGWRPAAGGKVLDPVLLDLSLRGEGVYMPGMPTLMLIDWGMKGWTCLHIIQQQADGVIVVIQTEYWHNERDETIYLRSRVLRDLYNAWDVCADGSHPYQNANLAYMGFNVTEVSFNQYKEMGAGWIRGLLEKGKLWIQGRKEGAQYYFDDAHTKRFFQQLKGWRRDKNGKIKKGDDHGPDALLCGVAKWGKAGPWKAEHAGAGRRASVKGTRYY